MAEQVEFELVSPEKLLLSEPVDMVVVPGGDGNFGVLPRHSPLISTVRPGVIDVYQKGSVEQRIFVAGGFAEVTGERCTILAEEAVPVEEIDRAETEQALKDAREDLADAKEAADKKEIEGRITILEAKMDAIKK